MLLHFEPELWDRSTSMFLLYPWLGNVLFLLHHMHVIWCHPSQMVQMWFSFVSSCPDPDFLVSGLHLDIPCKKEKPFAWRDDLVWSAESMLWSPGASLCSCCINIFTYHTGLFLSAASVTFVRDRLLEIWEHHQLLLLLKWCEIRRLAALRNENGITVLSECCLTVLVSDVNRSSSPHSLFLLRRFEPACFKNV